MRSLIQEAITYIELEWSEFTNKLKPSHIRNTVIRYDNYLKNLVDKDTTPKHLHKYIHREKMLYDQYMADEILVFCYDPKDEEDDNESFSSVAEYEDSHPDEHNFVNGVKVLDEYDFREQITANEFTGGYWDGTIHWVIRKKDLNNAVNSTK